MILLDTHIWVKWILEGGSALPASITARIESEDRVCISAISCLEMAWLVRNGGQQRPATLDYLFLVYKPLQ